MITEIILQNTTHVWLCQGSHETASKAADDLLTVMFNAHVPKEIFERNAIFGDEFFIEQRVTNFSLQEQKALIVKALMSLPPGQAFVRNDDNVTMIQTPLFESTTTDEELENYRKEQPWMMIGVQDVRSTTTSTESTRTPLSN